MMNILFAVMAIALTCLVTFGGVNYINTDAPIKATTSRALLSQYEVVVSGIVSYRAVNNGITPDRIERFEGFLPQGRVPNFGAGDDGYVWSVETPSWETSPVICLLVSDLNELRFATIKQLSTDIERRASATVILGQTCGEGVPHGEALIDAAQTKAVVTIRNF